MALYINFYDNNIRVYTVKYVLSSNRNCWRSDHLLPLVLAIVQILLGDEVGGPCHVVVLGLQVGVEKFTWLVTYTATISCWEFYDSSPNGVVEDLHLAFVCDLVTEGDEGQVIEHRIHHHHLPLHGSYSEAMWSNIRPDICHHKQE